MKTTSRAFTLIEVMTVLVVISILLGFTVPVAFNVIDETELTSERARMASMRSDVEQSFFETNQANNVGMIGGTGVTAATTTDSATTINTALDGSAVISAGTDWRAKLGSFRGGIPALPVTVTNPEGSSLSFYALNARRWERLLLAGPTNEVGQQRYLLVSMMTPLSRELTFPTTGSVFDEIWNNSWEGGGATAPAAWSARLTAPQYAEWNADSSGNRTNASRLIVERITHRKVDVVVVNNHPTDTVWVDIGPFTNAMTLAPNTGVSRSTGIAEFANGVPVGRLVVVRRGTTSPGSETQRFMLNSPVTVTVQ